jgi:hypothetical protein
MSPSEVLRDERTVVTENESYRWAYLVLSFGLLVCGAYRAFALGEAAWDLMALVVAGGVVTTAYQGLRGVLNRRWMWTQLATAALAAAIAVAIVLTR